jgi:F-type H+-transporting ATPase subunit b
MLRLTVLFAGVATPVLAAEGKPFFSLANTDFIVLLGFLVFVGVIFYFKVPGMISGMLDKRAADIQSDLDEARRIREEAQTVLATYERKVREVQGQADQIVEHAKSEARAAADQAKADIEASIARRLQTAQDKIASAEAGAIRDVRDRAAEIAVSAAAEVIAAQMSDADRDRLVNEAIGAVDAKLH